MKNKIMKTLIMASALFFYACNNKEKIHNIPAPTSTQTMTQTMTPGQVHNLIMEQYIQLYGITQDNEITLAEMELMCDRIADIADNANLLVNTTEADLADELLDMYVQSGAFVNGILQSPEALITSSINSVTNVNIKNTLTQIHNLALQGDPNFVSDATQLVNNLSNLTQTEQRQMDGFLSVLSSSYTLWGNPSYMPPYNGSNQQRPNVTMADAEGYVDGFNSSITRLGVDDYGTADFFGSCAAASRSMAARMY